MYKKKFNITHALNSNASQNVIHHWMNYIETKKYRRTCKQILCYHMNGIKYLYFEKVFLTITFETDYKQTVNAVNGGMWWWYNGVYRLHIIPLTDTMMIYTKHSAETFTVFIVNTGSYMRLLMNLYTWHTV